MQVTSCYLYHLASQDFLWRFLAQTMPIVPQKGFKQTWLEVYKKYYRASRNLTQDNFSYECATLRKHGKGQLITGVDCWSNFVFATTGDTVIVYLLDEEERDNNDIPMEKIKLESYVAHVMIQESDWNVCRLTVICRNTEIKQYLITQTETKAFTIKEHASLEQLLAKPIPL